MRKLYLGVLHAFHLARRPLTLGVRAVARRADGHVFLVRHTYVGGWYLPGGGVDPGETAEEALSRELAEEGNLAFDGRAQLVSAHFNRTASRRDHVLLYRVDGVRQTTPRVPDREIAECGFFDPAALPDEATPATRRRLEEVLSGRAPDSFW